MLNILLNHNLKNVAYEYQKLLVTNKDVHVIDCRKYDGNIDIDVTLNRLYLEKYATKQYGVQINRFCDGYFWHNKQRQQQLYLPCCTPLTIYGSGFTFIELRERLGVPFVAKRSISYGGTGTFLIKTQEDFDKATHCDIFQEMIWSSFGKDLRIFVIGGNIHGCMMRTNENDFRANIHTGGKGVSYPVDIEIEEIVKSIYEQTKLDIMGIDLLFGYSGYMFCELNVNPGFSGLDKALNIETAPVILDYALEKHRRIEHLYEKF